MSLAKNIQFLRKKHGLTQEDLSEYLCVSRQSISKWETGEAYPDTEKIIALCDRFDVSMDLLVRGDLTSGVVDSNSISDEKNVNEEIFESDNYSTENSFDNENVNNQDDIVSDSQTEEANYKVERIEKISSSICGLIMIVSITVFISIGVITNIWHPTWIACVCGAMVCAVVGIIFDLKKEKKNFEKIRGACCGILMCLTALAYVVINTFIGKWHPTWFMFIISSFICAVIGLLGNIFDKKTK